MKKLKFMIVIPLVAAGFIASCVNSQDEKSPEVKSQPKVKSQQVNLPFIGTRYFNFMGGNGTEESITINKDGTTSIKIYGKYGTGIEYQGKFSNPITLDDGSGWLLKDGKIYSLEGGKIAKGCMDDEAPCVSELYESD